MLLSAGWLYMCIQQVELKQFSIYSRDHPGLNDQTAMSKCMQATKGQLIHLPGYFNTMTLGILHFEYCGEDEMEMRRQGSWAAAGMEMRPLSTMAAVQLQQQHGACSIRSLDNGRHLPLTIARCTRFYGRIYHVPM